MIEYRTARSSTYLLISEAIVAIVKAKRNDFRMCHGDENRCGIYYYNLIKRRIGLIAVLILWHLQ